MSQNNCSADTPSTRYGKPITGTDGSLYFMATDELFPLKTPYLDETYNFSEKKFKKEKSPLDPTPLYEMQNLEQAVYDVEGSDQKEYNLRQLEIAQRRLQTLQDKLSGKAGTEPDVVAPIKQEPSFDVVSGVESSLNNGSRFNEDYAGKGRFSDFLNPPRCAESFSQEDTNARDRAIAEADIASTAETSTSIPADSNGLCPKPVCPTPVCPQPVCPKIDYSWFQQNFLIIVSLLVAIGTLLWIYRRR